jgi:hypothetical protein
MTKDMEFEALLYIAPDALQKKTGREDAGVRRAPSLLRNVPFSNRDGWVEEL